jgi:ribosomal protein S18 acetylase RimI-like enzyme
MKFKSFINEENKRIIDNDRYISIWIDKSCAEISSMMSSKKEIEEMFQIKIKEDSDNIWFFNRLKAYEEGKGFGSKLMKELVKILDKKNIILINHVNPYGNLNLNQLITFYKKFGFENAKSKLGNNLLIRYPK